MINPDEIGQKLLKSWSLRTSSKYTVDNPSRGQCSVTAIVIQEVYGGKILKTPVDGQWHFYNRIHGQRYDFTRQQFGFDPDYQDLDSDREEAFKDASLEQYHILLRAFSGE